jgi:hypothetical protein
MGSHPFTADEVSKWNPGLMSLWKLTLHLAGANLTATGATIVWLSCSGLRRGHTWVRPLLWLLLLWVGANDTIALLTFRAETGQGFPSSLIVTALGCLGLWISRQKGLA